MYIWLPNGSNSDNTTDKRTLNVLIFVHLRKFQKNTQKAVLLCVKGVCVKTNAQK